jgi:hypothetical protein
LIKFMLGELSRALVNSEILQLPVIEQPEGIPCLPIFAPPLKPMDEAGGKGKHLSYACLRHKIAPTGSPSEITPTAPSLLKIPEQSRRLEAPISRFAVSDARLYFSVIGHGSKISTSVRALLLND